MRAISEKNLVLLQLMVPKLNFKLRVVFTDSQPLIFVETPTLQRINPKYVFHFRLRW